LKTPFDEKHPKPIEIYGFCAFFTLFFKKIILSLFNQLKQPQIHKTPLGLMRSYSIIQLG
jgi:hypothetical protein